MKVFIEFGERGKCNTQTVVTEDRKLAQEIAIKLARVFGRDNFNESDFYVTQTIPRHSWIGHTHYVGVGIQEGV